MTKKNHDVIVKAYLNKDEYERRSRGISHGITKKRAGSKPARYIQDILKFNNEETDKK